SGDVLGGRIMENMPDVQFVGIGGQNVQAQGLKSLFPIADLAVMGVIEVLGRARTLMTRINQTVDAIIAEKPNVVLTIDSPGFAKSVITKLKKSDAGQKLIKNGLRFHHVVAPQVWAWRPKRAKKYARLFDKLYAFFDFELPYFTKYGLDTVAVGHPIADGLIGRKVQTKFKSDKKIITLVPGSRMSEVKRLLPLMRDVADTLSRNGYVGYHFVIPTVETTREYVRTQVEKWRIKPILVDSESRYDVYSQTYIAIVASGTVSAELAMLHIPTIVVYKMNKITSWLIKRFIRVRWVSLVNILLNRSVYPEFLGPDATVDNVLGAVQQLTIPSVRSKMTKALTEADDLWCRSVGGAGQQIAGYLYQA
ncbi:MAG: lipid-A-disaccharide synthase, partial [Alphaproteobacteria bacterium]|nr:lipid-A-disaccharide synthase [Alphaproteobacteria bacterium]